MSIITCSHKRSAKVAREITDKGFCSTKNMHYYGLKLHALCFRREGRLPFPEYIQITEASMNDLTALRGFARSLYNKTIFGDKIYGDKSYWDTLGKENNIRMLTPIKNKRTN